MSATPATLPAVNVTLSIGQADSLVSLFRNEANRLDAMLEVQASDPALREKLRNLPTKAGELRKMAEDVEAVVNALVPERMDMSRVR